ncbi:MAG TPA: hypothetical protein VFG45_04110 [Candidatus Nitrosocosmicus sp.]|nr:hypothetical protein [Candidatus Nitrosocosmicus sp.]
MTGTVHVIESTNGTETNKQIPIKKAGFYMMPSKDSDAIISLLTSDGYQVLGSHTSNDVKCGQKGASPTQTRIVWGSDKDNVEQLLQPIVDITKEFHIVKRILYL